MFLVFYEQMSNKCLLILAFDRVAGTVVSAIALFKLYNILKRIGPGILSVLDSWLYIIYGLTFYLTYAAQRDNDIVQILLIL